MNIADSEFGTERMRYEYLRKQLTNERSSFIPLYQDLRDYILPSGGRYYITETNRGDRRDLNILDNTASMAADVLRSGMQSGMTSASRPWFRLETPDPSLTNFPRVKAWLETHADRMSNFFIRSNLYQVLPINYGNAGVFATGCMSAEEDMDTLIRCYPFPAGSYMIANNARLSVDVFFREYRLTVRQLIQKFGERDPRTNKIDWSNFSVHVKNMYDHGNYETWIDVCHCVIPNDDYNPKKLHSKFKKYISVYYERGKSTAASGSYMEGTDLFLRKKGFDYFPIICPRWEITGEDAYGTSGPGIRSLGDTKQLQQMETRGLQAIDKMVTPPLGLPISMKGNPLSHLPGSATYYDDSAPQGHMIKSLYDVKIDLSQLNNREDGCRNRIEKSFYKHLFQQFIDDQRSGTSATEINAKKDEQLQQLGPVVSQLNEDQNDRIIEIGFTMMIRQGWVDPAPPELHGMPLKVVYISPMAQAQKIIGISGVERFISFAGGIVKVYSSAQYKIDANKVLDVYGDMMGIPSGIVRSDDDAQALQDQAQQAQEAQAKMDQLSKASVAAKNLSQADLSGNNALAQVAGGGNS